MAGRHDENQGGSRATGAAVATAGDAPDVEERSGIALTRAQWARVDVEVKSQTQTRTDHKELWTACHLGFIDEEQVASAIARRLRYQVLTALDVAALKPDSRARRGGDGVTIELLELAVALPHGFRPADGAVEIVVADPSFPDTEKLLSRIGRTRATITIGPLGAVTNAIRLLSRSARENKQLSGVTTTLEQPTWTGRADGDDQLVRTLQPDDTDESLNTLVNDIVEEAVRAEASDIHFEPDAESAVRVRIRVDGRLRTIRWYDWRSLVETEAQDVPLETMRIAIDRLGTFREALTRRVCNIAEIDWSKANQEPRSGRFEWPLKGDVKRRAEFTPIDVRANAARTAWGDMALATVLRLLRTQETTETLDTRELEPSLLRRVREGLRHRDGMLIMTGPVGSGKSTTLFTMLRALDREGIAIATIEDPVERRVSGWQQFEVRTGMGDFRQEYPDLLRAMLRHDFDVLLVGEIRDVDSARIARQAASTGHLLLTTVHANTALGAIERLTQLEMDPYSLSASVRQLMAQRLVRRLCPWCAQSQDDGHHREELVAILTDAGYSESIRWADFGLTDEDLREGHSALTEKRRTGAYEKPPVAASRILDYHGLRHPGQCQKCDNLGFRGRQGVFEIVKVTRELERAIQRRAPRSEMAEIAYADGARSLFASGLLRVLRGETSLGEVVGLGPDFDAKGPL